MGNDIAATLRQWHNDIAAEKEAAEREIASQTVALRNAEVAAVEAVARRRALREVVAAAIPNNERIASALLARLDAETDSRDAEGDATRARAGLANLHARLADLIAATMQLDRALSPSPAPVEPIYLPAVRAVAPAATVDDVIVFPAAGGRVA
jgi:hypothetical protein